jgi:hypothetical protein
VSSYDSEDFPSFACHWALESRQALARRLDAVVLDCRDAPPFPSLENLPFVPAASSRVMDGRELRPRGIIRPCPRGHQRKGWHQQNQS